MYSVLGLYMETKYSMPLCTSKCGKSTRECRLVGKAQRKLEEEESLHMYVTVEMQHKSHISNTC